MKLYWITRSSFCWCVRWQRRYIDESENADHASDVREPAASKSVSSRSQSRSHNDDSSTESTPSTKPASPRSPPVPIQARPNTDTLSISTAVPTERSSSQASEHYSSDFDEPSIARSTKKSHEKLSQPKKARKSPPSYVTGCCCINCAS